MLKGTTTPGFVNRNGQQNVGKTALAGNDYGQTICAMRCRKCGHCYGANGADIFQRKCPKYQGGMPCSTPRCVEDDCIVCFRG